jgi:ribonucleoside-diphosphate reductase alpha chain
MNVQDWLGNDNQLAIDIWTKKYQYKGETFDEFLDRVSGGNEEVKELIKQKKFLFGGRILANRGTEGNKTYSNCYVIAPPEDNLESIFDAAKKLARTYSYGGGCGIDLGKLRPKGAKVNNTAKYSTGAVSFMDLYNTTTGIIGQNGRRGALMLSMPVNHPDIEDFIAIKSDLTKITNANISVRVDDNFMDSVVNDQPYVRYWEGKDGEAIIKEIKAKELFHKICELNWNYAEPGILYWDRIKNHNLLQYDSNFEYAGVNPCAEEPLPAGGSCLLGAINLSEFVENAFTPKAYIDWGELEDAVHVAVEVLNEVLDEGLELHPLEEQQESVRNWRQIGLGIMGLADMLIKLGIKYGSKEANDLCCLLSRWIFDGAVAESEREGREKGSYPMFNELAVNNADMVEETFGVTALRNSQLLTIAPTGTLSTMLGISGGIEPIYANSYTRKTQSLHGRDEYYRVYTPIVKEYMEANGLTDESELPEYFVTAKDIDPMDRIDCQGAWQDWIDASISSTINLPNTATVEDIEKIYIEAWKRGLKGVTVYRDGCAREGVLSTENKKENPKVETRPLDYITPITRNELGKCLGGSTYVKDTACGKLYITINHDENGNLVEVFIDPSKSGGCVANAECLGRYASMAMRGGMKIESVIDATKGIKCSACTKSRGVKNIDGLSCGDIVARTIQEEYEKLKGIPSLKVPVAKPVIQPKQTVETSKCPKCGESLAYSGGCKQCLNCGWSKCD